MNPRVCGFGRLAVIISVLSAFFVLGTGAAMADGMSDGEWRAVESGREIPKFQPNPESIKPVPDGAGQDIEKEDERLIELEKEMLKKLAVINERKKAGLKAQ